MGSMLRAADLADSFDGSGMGLQDNLLSLADLLQAWGIVLTLGALFVLPFFMRFPEVIKAVSIGVFTAFFGFLAGAYFCDTSTWLRISDHYTPFFADDSLLRR